MEQQRLWIAVAVAMAMMVLPFHCLATDYTVGDSAQWNLGVNYSSWASGKTFAVGDKLVFKYAAASHDTLVVNKAAYDSCLNTNPLSSHNTGNDTITLDSTGAKYYICGIAGHCSGGMKLTVTVGASTTKSNVTAPSPSPTPSPSSATPPTPSASSPSPSSATPTTPTASSPSPTSTTTPPAVSTPPESTNGANPPSGSGTNSSAAAPSYRMDGAFLLAGSVLLAIASL